MKGRRICAGDVSMIPGLGQGSGPGRAMPAEGPAEARAGPRIFIGKLNKDTSENDVRVSISAAPTRTCARYAMLDGCGKLPTICLCLEMEMENFFVPRQAWLVHRLSKCCLNVPGAND